MKLGAWLFLATHSLAAVVAAQSPPVLRRTAPAARAVLDERSLFSTNGERVGTWQVSGGEFLLRPDRGPAFPAPPLQSWLGSEDGRTLAGAGQPEAWEHPFELRFVVYRDGQRVAELPEVFATESEFTVGADGTVAIAGHLLDRLGEPLALALSADGRRLYRHELPRGLMVRDPVLFGERLLVRSHGLLTEGVDGAIWAVDALDARLVLDAPGVLRLAGFPAAGAALVLTRDSVRWIDALDGRVHWERKLALRPAGEDAFELWRARARDALAIVTAGLPRRGEPGPLLWLLDPRDGAVLAVENLGELEGESSPAEVGLSAPGEELLIDWNGTREVFTWER